MDEFDFAEIWKQLLPANVRVAAGPIMGEPPPLTRSELASAGPVSPGRLRELQCSRYYAKQALSKLGVEDVELLVAKNRAPAWPNGVVGSITHVQKDLHGYCAVAVAKLDEIQALGIDLECDAGLGPRAWASILSRDELAQICALPIADRQTEVLSRWCMKEAVVKASLQVLEPKQIHTDRQQYNSFAASWPSRSNAVTCWQGRTTRLKGSDSGRSGHPSLRNGRLLMSYFAIRCRRIFVYHEAPPGIANHGHQQ